MGVYNCNGFPFALHWLSLTLACLTHFSFTHSQTHTLMHLYTHIHTPIHSHTSFALKFWLLWRIQSRRIHQVVALFASHSTLLFAFCSLLHSLRTLPPLTALPFLLAGYTMLIPIVACVRSRVLLSGYTDLNRRASIVPSPLPPGVTFRNRKAAKGGEGWACRARGYYGERKNLSCKWLVCHWDKPKNYLFLP